MADTLQTKKVTDLAENTAMSDEDLFMVGSAGTASLRKLKWSNIWNTIKTAILGKLTANNLTTTAAGYLLDARQGKALDDKISELNTHNTKIKRIYNVKTGNTETENYLCPVEAGKAYLILVREMSEATNITGFGLYYLCAARSSNSACSTGKVCGDLDYIALGLSGGLKIQLNIRAQYKDISVFEVPMM